MQLAEALRGQKDFQLQRREQELYKGPEWTQSRSQKNSGRVKEKLVQGSYRKSESKIRSVHPSIMSTAGSGVAPSRTTHVKCK